jgi:hypothetical protein
MLTFFHLALQQYASAMVLRLQLALHEVIEELDNIGKEAVGNIPRVLRDIDTVRYVEEAPCFCSAVDAVELT